MDIQGLYQQKLTTPTQAAEYLRDGDNLVLGMSVAMPPALMQGVADALHQSQLNELNLYYMHGTQALCDTILVPELADKVCPRPLFMSGHDRQALKKYHHRAMMEFVPASFSQVGRLLTEYIEPHCFMVTVSPMDRHGYFSLGTNADYGASVIRKAGKVIVEVNENMPRTFGECSVHISEIDAIVENHTPLIEIQPHPPSDIDLQIARLITERIDDGDTLQMGVGGVPNSVLGLLHDHKDLGLHSELFSPAMVGLIERGVLNGRRKLWMQHKHVFTLALGDKAMYDFMDDNPSIVGYPASWVNNPMIIQKNQKMVSVNAAIEVDLTGQINAEQLAGQPFSGTGGQLDFVRGAFRSKGGRSFIALQSTAKGGTLSRIVPTLLGGTVTDTRMDTQFVVTEYGCVDLKGLSLPQRARALISIAHPAFRDQLHEQARALDLI
ncbi:4-hydroxybutyrate CoA-transferase [Bacterioplanes sanyensis]|uniref:acetyl-CoA hydrolase/transferase family protein n=1 Tax=Bacterioplanes sanyensis TaxID=1249553 RepID=UPI0016738266|nr:acetyl-CoA hydrolase/transferase family protein [Bacterioplanes sanyensis]GGY52373.1 4-hydroxybutyrate CoA-transferase [Bacterioplanes sanyensis]